jgi:DnaJ-class molecular chaperone
MEDIRAAYLRQVKEHPPESDPEAFERIRAAYETLSDPRRRIHYRLFSWDPEAPLVSLLEGRRSERRFTGPGPWLAALRGK